MRDTFDLANRFAYCSGNPVMNSDPEGHIPIEEIESIVQHFYRHQGVGRISEMKASINRIVMSLIDSLPHNENIEWLSYGSQRVYGLTPGSADHFQFLNMLVDRHIFYTQSVFRELRESVVLRPHDYESGSIDELLHLRRKADEGIIHGFMTAGYLSWVDTLAHQIRGTTEIERRLIPDLRRNVNLMRDINLSLQITINTKL